MSFLASVRALWVERALRKNGPEGQKVEKAGKKLVVWGWAFGGSKMAGNRKKSHFRKKQSGCFHLKKKSGLRPQNQAFGAWSGAEQIFEFGRKWAWGWYGGRTGRNLAKMDFNELDLNAQMGYEFAFF